MKKINRWGVDVFMIVWYTSVAREKKMENLKKELLEIGNTLIKEKELQKIKIQFKHISGGGSARFKTRKITIPIWAIKGMKDYAIYYIIHEITHFIIHEKFSFSSGHSKIFKEIEMIELAKHNIKPVYKKAYPKYLEDLNGIKLCNEFGVGVDV